MRRTERVLTTRWRVSELLLMELRLPMGRAQGGDQRGRALSGWELTRRTECIRKGPSVGGKGRVWAERAACGQQGPRVDREVQGLRGQRAQGAEAEPAEGGAGRVRAVLLSNPKGILGTQVCPRIHSPSPAAEPPQPRTDKGLSRTMTHRRAEAACAGLTLPGMCTAAARAWGWGTDSVLTPHRPRRVPTPPPSRGPQQLGAPT